MKNHLNDEIKEKFEVFDPNKLMILFLERDEKSKAENMIVLIIATLFIIIKVLVNLFNRVLGGGIAAVEIACDKVA